MELVAMLVLITIVGAIVVLPLVRPRPDPDAAAEIQAPDPGEAVRKAQSALRDLEFDHATGKLADGDYHALRTRYETAAVAAAAAALRSSTPPPDDLSERLEAEILAVRRGRRYCTTCGLALPRGARFCPACGTAAGVPA